MDGHASVKRAECQGCGASIILADAGGYAPEPFEPGHTRMLVVLSFPKIDGKTRVALGPCLEKHGGELHAKDDEPTVYFGHARHRCRPKKQPESSSEGGR